MESGHDALADRPVEAERAADRNGLLTDLGELGRERCGRQVLTVDLDDREVGERVGRADAGFRAAAARKQHLDVLRPADDVIVRHDRAVSVPDHAAALAVLHDHRHHGCAARTM